jgi:hypothetical protein
MINITSLNEAH